MNSINGGNRVVIEVSGGVAEENINLAKGPVTTYIIDWDDINESTVPQVLRLLENYPQDIQEYIKINLLDDITIEAFDELTEDE